ncbi:hypothetical protein FB451DRAFT_1451164 [Mycena latifolia]|nr:hypothetical protein FB451DRAFT_1451164 [Mycena latifolia]
MALNSHTLSLVYDSHDRVRPTKEQNNSAGWKLLDNMPFESLGEFLELLFHNRPHGERNPRGPTHSSMVGRFLHGADNKRMSHILPLIYRHRSRYPSINSAHPEEQDHMFSMIRPLEEIRNARLYMSTWASRLVAVEVRRQVGHLTKGDPDDPTQHVQLRAATNGHGRGHVVTWWDFEGWRLKCVTIVGVKGICRSVVRERRPHPIVGAMASFILSRNRYANGDLAMILGWHFASKSHIDVKRSYSRFGNSVADTTARDAMNSMTVSSLADLRTDVQGAIARNQMEHALILDNCQEYCDVYIRAGNWASKRDEGRVTPFQPLSTNSAKSTELPGMANALQDFTTQMGIDQETTKDLLFWTRGDGASYANILRLAKYGAPLGTFQNIISTPEIWHTGGRHRFKLDRSESFWKRMCLTAGGTRLQLINTPTTHLIHTLYFKTDNLYEYLENLANKNQLPDLQTILRDAAILSERYTSQAAILRSLSATTSTNPAQSNQIPVGSPWVAPLQSTGPAAPNGTISQADANSDMPDLAEISDAASPTVNSVPQKDNDAPKIHEELPEIVLYEAMGAVTADKARGWFQHSGYNVL